jgi:hypothetical protein
MQSVRFPVVLVGCAWFIVAACAGAAGLVQKMTVPLPQVILFALTNILLLLFWGQPQFRAWALGESLRVLVAIHITRFVGIYFLILHGRGELPYAFAVPGGWGDIIVATAATLLVCFVRPQGKGLKFYLLWNLLGFLDILMVVFTAARLGLAEPASMAALTRFPLSLLPTFLVPIIIATHILLFLRLLHPRADR